MEVVRNDPEGPTNVTVPELMTLCDVFEYKMEPYTFLPAKLGSKVISMVSDPVQPFAFDAINTIC